MRGIFLNLIISVALCKHFEIFFHIYRGNSGEIERDRQIALERQAESLKYFGIAARQKSLKPLPRNVPTQVKPAAVPVLEK